MRGDVGVSGAIFDDLLFGGSSAGSARVYRYIGNTWTPEQSLFSPEPFPSQRFGVTVATSGDWIAVGAGDAESGCGADPDCDTGKVYLYEYNGSSWAYDQSLLPQAGFGSPEDQFGRRLDIDGTRTVVAATEDDNANGIRAGAAYVFERITLFGSTFWTQTAKLLASDGDDFDTFGSDVGVSGTWAIVGADSDESGGSAYLFEDTGGAWPQKQKLHPAGLPASSDFGYAVAIDGDVAVIGAPDFGTGTGKVYVYENFGGLGWLLTATLAAHDGSVGDSFGASVSIAGDQVIVGAPTNLGRGAAYLFWRVNGGWVERAKLVAGDGAANDSFGGSVAIDSGLGLVGAYFDNIGLLSDVGSVYRFNGLFDCTANGVAEACDIANGLPDSDADGIPNICEP
jgi:FG-GAP repeat